MTSAKIRYAVVGGGQISQQAFMPGVGQTDNSELAALVTGDPVKAEKLAGKYAIKAWRYEDYDALLASDEVDAVYVATPNHLHTDYVVKALEAGIHVLCEKPLATSVADCEAMLAAQRRSGAKLMTAYRLHFEPGTVQMFTRAQNGDFGTLRSFSSSFTQDVNEENSRAKHGYWGGPVPDMGAYPLNAVRNLFGAEPISVHAVGTKDPKRGFNFNDTVAVTLRFSEDRVAQFTVSYATAASEGFTLVGTDATITAGPAFMFADTAITYVERRDGKTEKHRFDPVDQFGGETQYFSDCILNGHDPEPDGEEGLMDVRVMAAVEESLKTGKTVDLPAVHRGKRVAASQALALPPSDAPSEDEVINVVTQSA